MNAILRFKRNILVRQGPLRSFALVVVFSLLLSACGGSKPPSTPPAAAGSTVTGPAESGPTATPEIAELGAVVWSAGVDPTSAAPVSKMTFFANDAGSLFAVVPVKNVTPGLVLSAKWTYNDTDLTGVGSTITATSRISAGWVEFHLSHAPGQTWPVGVYKIEIRQDHAAPVESSIEVKRAGG